MRGGDWPLLSIEHSTSDSKRSSPTQATGAGVTRYQSRYRSPGPESTQKYYARILRPVEARDDLKMTQTDLVDMETSYPTLNIEVRVVQYRFHVVKTIPNLVFSVYK